MVAWLFSFGVLSLLPSGKVLYMQVLRKWLQCEIMVASHLPLLNADTKMPGLLQLVVSTIGCLSLLLQRYKRFLATLLVCH